ncbi:hypothetical protein [Rhizobium cremeum]|nr:hypothetical protein [Rhizobium cremeum]
MSSISHNPYKQYTLAEMIGYGVSGLSMIFVAFVLTEGWLW